MKIPFYKYSEKDLEYQNVVLKPKTILIGIGVLMLFSTIMVFLLSLIFSTPKEIRLKKEIKSLKQQYYFIDKKTDDVYYLLSLLKRKDSIIYQSLFNVSDEKNKFESGYITEDNLGFNDSIATIGNKLSNIEMILEFNNNKFQNIITELMNSNSKLQHTPAIQPLSNKTLEFTSSGFGLRLHPIYKVKKYHYGMDFVAKIGTPVYATADGTIEIAEKDYHGYGGYILINHGYEYKTAYGHLSNLSVKSGQVIKRGQLIGNVGNTGLSTGPHLHYEVIYGGKPVNPINYYFNDITASQYDEMLKISNNVENSMD